MIQALEQSLCGWFLLGVNMSKSGLTPFQDECLEILAEECAEVIQEKSKIFRFGAHMVSWHHPGLLHAQCLEAELGDLLAMIEMVQLSGIGISAEGLQAAKQKKLEKVLKWMTHKKGE
jgi:hypothetical protein